jgi:hypothetical protein
LPFVCAPAGTQNHFALDLGVDRHDLVGGLDAFTDGAGRLVDIGSVNGRLFVNNVSLGIYGEAVRQAAYRDAKARTLLETAVRVLGPSESAPTFASWTTRAASTAIRAVDLGTPLDFSILPAALSVRIPARHPGVSPSGLIPRRRRSTRLRGRGRPLVGLS